MLVVVMFVFFQPFACLSQVFRCRDLWYRLSSRKDNIDEIEEIAQDSPFTFVVLETDCLQAVIPGLFGVSLEEQIYLREVVLELSLIHISEPTRLGMISYAVFCLKKKKKKNQNNNKPRTSQ